MEHTNFGGSIARANLLLLLSAGAFQCATAQAGSTQYGLNSNFNPSMAVIIVVLICAFFFMGFFSIYIRQCIESNAVERRAGQANSARGRRFRRLARGLDGSVIDTFPIFSYSKVKGLKMGKGALECAVCLNEFEVDEMLRLLPKCNHVFHPDCIDAWLFGHTTCPVCRSDLVPDSAEILNNYAAVALAAQTPQSGDESDLESARSETSEVQTQVRINVNEDRTNDPRVFEPTPKRNGPSKSCKFSRSHSTGHLLVKPGENCERFTLRLPDEVRRQIVSGELKRTKSCAALQGEWSCRGGYRSGGEGGGSSRGKSYQYLQFGSRRSDPVEKLDRWVSCLAPPFFSRTTSVRRPMDDGEKEAPASVISAFDRWLVKADGTGHIPNRPPV